MKKIYSSLLVILVGFLPLYLKNHGWGFSDVTRTDREETTLREEVPPREEVPVEEAAPTREDYYAREEVPVEEETTSREDPNLYPYEINSYQAREEIPVEEETPSRDDYYYEQDPNSAENTSSRDPIPATRDTTSSRDSTTTSLEIDTSTSNTTISTRDTPTSRDSTPTSRDSTSTSRETDSTSREISPTRTAQNRASTQEIQREFSTEIAEELSKRGELPIYNRDNERTTITRNTKIQVIPDLKAAEEEIRNSLRRNVDPNNYIIITTSTDSDRDGTSDLQEIQDGTNPSSQDTDDDGISDSEEILVYNSNPLKAEKIDRTPIIASITNLDGNKTTGSYPLVKGISKPGEKITITATQDHKNNTKICETESDEQGVFVCQTSQELKDGDYYLYANSKKEIKIKVAEKQNDQEIKIEVKEVPKVLSVLRNTQKVLNVLSEVLGTDMAEVFYRAPLEKLLSSQSTVQKLIGQSDPDTSIIFTWQSTTFSSTVLTDANQGNFEATLPDKMGPGKHTVLAYIYNKKSNSISNVKKISFIKS